MPNVLVVDDDPTVSEVVGGYLERAGFSVQHAGEGATGLELARLSPPDLVVLDVMLPGLDGIEVCRRLRAVSDVPIIMLTALGGEVDRVLGLEVGADDYLTKPFSPRELVLRVQSVLRRTGRQGIPPGEGFNPVGGPAIGLGGRPVGGSHGGSLGGSHGGSHGGSVGGWAGGSAGGPVGGQTGGPLWDGDLEVDVVARRARLGGRALSLTVREFDLLAHLLRHPGTAFTREDLMKQVWGWDFGDLSTVTVHVRRVRSKVEVDPAAPVRLVTVWGVGYRWEAATTPPGAAPADALS